MQTVAFLNQKGGVGKTSCTHHLGGALAGLGKRVLLVDADPQSSLTQGLLGPEALDALDPDRTVAAVLLGRDPFAADVVRPSGVPGVDLMPGSKAAYDANTLNPWLEDYAVQARLAGVLRELPRYDVCLIDCPPNFQGCSWAALVAADALVVPLQPEDYGAQGIRAVQDCIEEVRAGANPGLQLAGYLVTMYNARLSIHKMYLERLEAAYGRDVFGTRVPYAADYKEAIALRQPVSLYKPKGASAKATRALAVELLARLEVAAGEAA
jgi:chromosome partitioning protein